MKCNCCGSEWNASSKYSASLTNCPFCGKPFPQEKRSFDTVEDVLAEIISRFGIDVLNNGQKTIALFSDLSPTLRRERLLLTYLTQAGGNRKLLEVRDKPTVEQQACFLQVCKYMTDEQLVAEDAAQNICTSFSNAIGISIAMDEAGKGRIQSPISAVSLASPQRQKTTNQTNPPKKSINPVSSSPLQTYAEYKNALEKYYIHLGKSPLSDSQILYFITTNSLDKRGITISYVQKSLRAIYAKYNQKNSTPVTPTKSTPPASSPRIKSFTEYRRVLDEYCSRVGRLPLTEHQIQMFISVNALDRDWDISVADVQKDLSAIYAKYKPNTTAPVTPKISTSPPVSSPRIKNYTEYLKILEDYFNSSGKVQLTEHQIRTFISANALDRDWNISVADVQKDLSSIYVKNNCKALQAENKGKFRLPWHKK